MSATQWSAAGQRFGYRRRYSVEISSSSVCLPDVLPTWTTPHGIIIHHSYYIALLHVTYGVEGYYVITLLQIFGRVRQ